MRWKHCSQGTQLDSSLHFSTHAPCQNPNFTSQAIYLPTKQIQQGPSKKEILFNDPRLRESRPMFHDTSQLQIAMLKQARKFHTNSEQNAETKCVNARRQYDSKNQQQLAIGSLRTVNNMRRKQMSNGWERGPTSYKCLETDQYHVFAYETGRFFWKITLILKSWLPNLFSKAITWPGKHFSHLCENL